MRLHVTLLQEGKGEPIERKLKRMPSISKATTCLEKNTTFDDDDSLVERYVFSLYGQGA
jgi:hypothetical protein